MKPYHLQARARETKADSASRATLAPCSGQATLSVRLCPLILIHARELGANDDDVMRDPATSKGADRSFRALGGLPGSETNRLNRVHGTKGKESSPVTDHLMTSLVPCTTTNTPSLFKFPQTRQDALFPCVYR